ncbi:MAG: DUF255 domain-containing protein [Planctomycetota bacterium]|nr:MAG: DUF255 domain-containing protein [Planctomycetota bacterium]
MAEQEYNDNQASDGQVPENIRPATNKKHSRALWILALVFIIFVGTVFFTQRKGTINWVEDYEAGIELAKQLNKPVLLTFYKLHTRFCSDMSQNTYNDPDVIKYVEATFVPIFIDVDKHPEIARLYNVDYYPTHYIKQPDSNKLSGPHLGYDVPSAFIRKLEELLEKMDAPER